MSELVPILEMSTKCYDYLASVIQHLKEQQRRILDVRAKYSSQLNRGQKLALVGVLDTAMQVAEQISLDAVRQFREDYLKPEVDKIFIRIQEEAALNQDPRE